MSQKITFQIITPEKVVYQDEIDQVTIPTKQGQITVLPHHIPLISIIEPGELIIKNNSQEVPVFISGGFVEVRKGNKIIILADSAERVQEIDETRAEQARERALALQKEKFTDDIKFGEAAVALERALARLKIVRKHKSRTR